MPAPPVRVENTAILAGVAVDLSRAVQLPSGEHVVTAGEAIELAVALIRAAVHCDPKVASVIRAENQPVPIVLQGGPLDDYETELESFFGLVPAVARMSVERIPGNFKYRNAGIKRRDRWVFEFVSRMKEGERLHA